MKGRLGFLIEQAIKEWKRWTKKINLKDIDKVFKKSGRIAEIFMKNKQLAEFRDSLKIMLSLVKDYIDGNYKEVPYYSIAAIVAALLYVLSPIDLIPDYIPVFGYIDDAAVVKACLIMIDKDIEKYKKWKNL